MNYTNVSVNAQGQAPILINGTGSTTNIGFSCGNFTASQLPFKGTSYTIHATDSKGKMIELEGCTCVTPGTISTFAQ